MKKKDETAGEIPMAFDLTHARHDPAHCLAPGLFRSLKRGDRKKLKLDVTYHYGEGEQIEFSGPEPLGADDLRILQGLIAMGGPKGIILTSEPSLEPAKQLRLFLEPTWEAAESDGLVVKGSYRALAKEIGYANIEDSKPIRECIERLWKVSIIVAMCGGRADARFKAVRCSELKVTNWSAIGRRRSSPYCGPNQSLMASLKFRQQA